MKNRHARRGAPVAALLLLAAGAWAQGPSPVRVATVESQSVVERRRVTGEIRSLRRAEIAAQEAGWVEELAVREGERVEEGALLARVDRVRLELALAEVETDEQRLDAVLAERLASVERAKRDVDALRALTERNASNKKVLADAESDLRVATARHRAVEGEQAVARARTALLRERLADTEIRAPWPGRVVARNTEVGEWLAVGDPVVELLSSESLEVWLIVPQRHFGAVGRDGAAVEVEVDATRTRFDTADLRTVPLVDARARTFHVVAAIEGELARTGRIAAGMSVTAWVPTDEERERLLVPRDAILRNEVGTYVWVAQPGAEGEPSTAMFTPVDVAFSVGSRAAVESPALSAGALVVIEGNERLFPMAPVIPMPEAAPQEAAQ